ncbi:cobalamin biosynthesis protein CobG [Roseovarius nitratireducens]|uniref:cobalamin biosynthesis protein CobG n=1 Tax=Roseovarius nitratireducens TaxID=2044597 RepID=UPI001F0B9937|nr:cobalamin biosynthesis protein CobG [Roseovarius nitratireducens]
MMSGDGLVVRVRPFRATLSPDQVHGLCDLARRFGNGTLDLTSRANLQIRAVAEVDFAQLLVELDGLGLLDADPAIEGHRNILMAPDWTASDLTDRLYGALLDILPGLPRLPEKMGYALDTGVEALLVHGSADFRFEKDTEGRLLLRADGAAKGRPVEESDAFAALSEMVAWFVESGGFEAGRMARHLRETPLPDEWQVQEPRAAAMSLSPGPTGSGLILGAPFGSLSADALDLAMQASGVTEMRLMLGRLFWLRGSKAKDAPGFVATPASALLTAHACPGAPLCPQATVETRVLAKRLAERVDGSLHVSGCAKGCAQPRRADVTLTGRNGRYDLVRNGAPWEEPSAQGLATDDLHDLTRIP